MITFVVSIVLLILGYLVYGKVIERIFGIDTNRKTPAIEMPDGVDYVAMPWWKIFLIQFLNIAGLGPIFGAIMGVMFGPAAFLWIVFGCIFGGAVHDYLSGMLSLRRGGISLPELIGQELGEKTKFVMRLFTIVIMILVGAVFISGPAGILAGMVGGISVNWWIIIIFAYYILATMLPIDKIIGRIYPVFGICLLFMAIGVCIAMIANGAPIPEISEGLKSRHPAGYPVFPMMFVSIACGAVSGFHATQSPLMARCMTNERYGRPCFYGAMIAEGIVALIWATAAASFYGSIEGLQEHVASLPASANKAAEVVNEISLTWLGKVGGLLALLGVVAAPITSGDTAMRSCRLIIADMTHIEQKSIAKRLMITVPIFVIVFVLLQINFDIIWRYFAWSNQALSVFTLWALSVYLVREKKFFWVALVPALFMTAVCSTYIVVAPEGFGANIYIGYAVAAVVCIIFSGMFIRLYAKTHSMQP